MGTTDYTIPQAQGGRGCMRDEILRHVASALHANYGATSVAAILAATSVSSREVECEFGSADALLVAVARTIAEWMLAPLGDLPTQASFKRQLAEFSRRATDEYSGMRLKNLYRLAICDAVREAWMNDEVYRNGPALLHSELARFFSSARSAGVRLQPDSVALADHFMALLRSHWDLSDTSGVMSRRPTDGELDRLVEAFFKGAQAGFNHA